MSIEGYAQQIIEFHFSGKTIVRSVWDSLIDT